ncbi:heavy metal translocating P-type ATPase [Naumannella halotolerans]|uniref:P-type E1-E2 ATPase/heavy metal translocating P-type ATPase n=1 Tax=Naumannella halotolerans TaxID=993414 RepID=A0A4V3EMV6_9ACTN|nr:heavy metal translocating P-type ATPase [Naumannella halotolerans]TDT31028.1 P-type E1-E2 ATPase/heavy metal translocating P-type ATPase [Naumannella halotolerans]
MTQTLSPLEAPAKPGLLRETLQFSRSRPLMVFVVIGLATGVTLWATGQQTALAITAFLVVGVVIVTTAIGMVRDLMSGHWGLDVLAVVAMVATLAVQEYVAGLIIALMLTGGEALEAVAARRASRELDMLLNHAPAFAQRVDPVTGDVQRIPVDEVAVGDELLVRSSEVLPVDGTLLSEHASIDESSVTGEPLPVSYQAGDSLLSGTVNGTESLTMRAEKVASESNYAGIVKLVEAAVDSRAPMVRLADRYAVPFTILALLIAGVAWYVSGDPVRFAEVLVVATPCPLLIATPVAFMGGMSSAAKLNVIIKDGGALEVLARVRSAAFDKTGTLTQGKADVVNIVPAARSARETLQLAAAAEQFSVHVFAEPIIAAARVQKRELPQVAHADEVATNGVHAVFSDGTQVRVGKPAFIEEVTGHITRPALAAGETAVYVAVGNELAGVIVLSDPLRPQAADTVARLRAAGVEEIAMVTGDVAPTAESIAHEAGITTVHAETTPQTKVELVQAMRPRPVLMVGDGINDAPVLAAANVGIAMAGRGATVASESASAVITADDISRVADVMYVSRRTVTIALQSIWLGIIISVGLMLVAAFGYLPAVVGALLQEVVDLVAIVSALRALSIHRRVKRERGSGTPLGAEAFAQPTRQ